MLALPQNVACRQPYRYGIPGANGNSSLKFLAHPLFVQE